MIKPLFFLTRPVPQLVLVKAASVFGIWSGLLEVSPALGQNQTLQLVPQPGEILRLEAAFRARKTPHFGSSHFNGQYFPEFDNLAFPDPLRTGTRVQVLNVVRLQIVGSTTEQNANQTWGLRVRVLDGERQNEEVYIQWNANRPHMSRLASRNLPPSREEKRPNQSFQPPKPSLVQPCQNCTPSNPTETLTKLQEDWGQLSVWGARHTMAVMYQNCNVLKFPPLNPTRHPFITPHILKVKNGNHINRFISRNQLPRLIQSHYYLSLPSPGGMCRDMRQTPPVFNYGARPLFRDHGREIVILQPRMMGKVPTVGLDCSAFISVALSVAGFKVNPRVRNANENLVTSTSLIGMDGHNSCFNRVTMRTHETLKPGDIISMPGHVMMVESVGPDPLGIERLIREGRLRNVGQCRGFPPPSDYLNFRLIQSSGYGDLPASIMEAKHYIRPNRTQEGIVYSTFRDIFEAACLARFQGRSRVVNRRGSTLLRHKGTTECMFSDSQRPRLAGSECTGQCG